jgi:hypothetical protein
VLGDLRARLLKHMRSTGDPLLEGPVISPMHRDVTGWLKQA